MVSFMAKVVWSTKIQRITTRVIGVRVKRTVKASSSFRVRVVTMGSSDRTNIMEKEVITMLMETVTLGFGTKGNRKEKVFSTIQRVDAMKVTGARVSITGKAASTAPTETLCRASISTISNTDQLRSGLQMERAVREATTKATDTGNGALYAMTTFSKQRSTRWAWSSTERITEGEIILSDLISSSGSSAFLRLTTSISSVRIGKTAAETFLSASIPRCPSSLGLSSCHRSKCVDLGREPFHVCSSTKLWEKHIS